MKVINFISAGRRHIVIVDGVRNEFGDFKDALRCIRENAGGYFTAHKLITEAREKGGGE